MTRPVPIPFAKRLPEPYECNEEGLYWCNGVCGGYFDKEETPVDRRLWVLSRAEDEEDQATHWLPFEALPMPPAAKEANL
jgi:hypothetical protein